MATPPLSDLERTDPLVILGAGRLGVHLAVQLRHAGCTRITLWNRSPLPPAREAWLELEPPAASPAPRPPPGPRPATPAPRLVTGPPPATPAPRLVTGPLPAGPLHDARLVLLTVADDALEPLAATLAAPSLIAPDASILHCSGALTGAVLAPLATLGHPTGSMHPLQSFSSAPVPHGLRGTFFAIEGHARAVRDAATLAGWLEGRTVPLRSEGKVLYHTAAVVASNLLVALTSLAVEIMGEATGPAVSAGERLELLMPLIEGTVANLKRIGLPGALTGPVSRGDAGVVARQLAALEAAQAGEAGDRLAIYRALSARALELARAQGLAPEACEALARLLAG